MEPLQQPWEEAAPKPRSSLLAWLVALAVFSGIWLLCFVLFTVLVIVSEPTRNRWIAALALFVLIVGTSFAAGLAFAVYHKILARRQDKALAASRGGVFDGDWRS
jgi:ABC-type transport system involved in multi-copper enzyme maturation permease subunit